MRFSEFSEAFGVGLITAQNTTADVKPGETQRQARKWGFKVDKKGKPPTLRKKTRGSVTNVLYNLGKVKEELEPELNENALKALRFATAAHKGQTRKSGDPYISHPKEVARFVKQFKKSNNLSALIQAAYLHDTIEDTDTTHEDLVKQFGGLVADMVKELTSDKEAIQALGKGEYIAGKMAKMSSWALVVKLADRLANVQDIDSRPSEFQRRYAAQTKQAIDRLRSDRYLSATHNKIISAIEDKIKEYLEPEVTARDTGESRHAGR